MRFLKLRRFSPQIPPPRIHLQCIGQRPPEQYPPSPLPPRSQHRLSRYPADLSPPRRFQAGEGEPELHRQWDDFESPSKEDLGIGHRGLEVDGFFPQADGVGDVFKGFSQHEFFGLGILLELSSCKPDLDALTNMLNGIGEDNFRVFVGY